MQTSLRDFLENQEFKRIPLKKLLTGHYKLSLQINGIKGDFILDTGASTSCVGFDDIDHFKLKNEASEVKAAGAGAINMDTQLAPNNSLIIGGKLLHGIDFVLFDLTHVNDALSQVHEKPIKGILGAELLKHLRAVIDYGRNCLYIK